MRDYDIESDLKQEKFQSIKLVQGDRGNKIKINVYEDGQPVKLTGCSITAKYKRADGEVVDGTVENKTDNYFYAVMDNNITKVAGTLKMLFNIENGDVKVSTFLLLADVREGIGENTGSSGGDTEVTVDLKDYQKKTDNGLETKNKYIVGAINEVNSQCKDIANLKIDNITLSDNVLTFFANSKTIKTITLPTSTTGGGTNGKEIELQKSTTHIQWRYVGDTDWTNLVALSDLKGTDGDTGLSAYELAQQETGFAGTVEQWLNSLVGATPNLAIGTVETLASGSSATASITGTTENPLLNLGIPRGNDGASGTGGNSEGWELIDDVIFEETVSTYAKTFDKEYDEINIFLLNLDSESISDSWSNLTLNPSNGNINIRTGTVETNKGLFININRLGNHYIYYVANNVMTSSVLGTNIRLFYGLGSTSSKIKGLSFGSSSILKATNRLIIAGR